MTGVLGAYTRRAGFAHIADFLKEIARHWGTNTLFRGHGDAKWNAVPSAFREGATGLVSDRHMLQWKSMAQRFVSPRPIDEIEYLVLAQHYGVKTALLDWSSNPLTALFFACELFDREDHRNGAVIAIERDEFAFCTSNTFIKPFETERDRPLLIDTSAMNPRSMAQDSFMSLHVRQERPLEVNNIFTVAHSNKLEILAALETLGLTPERVYADVSVAAKRMMNTIMLSDEFDDLLERKPFDTYDDKAT